MCVYIYICVCVSPSWELRTASSRGRYGGRRQCDPCLKHTYKNTTCWPATAYDIATIYHSIKGRRENTSSTSFSEACIRSMAQRLEDAVSRSPLEVCTGSKLKPEPGPYPRSSDLTRAAQLNLEPEPDPKSLAR